MIPENAMEDELNANFNIDNTTNEIATTTTTAIDSVNDCDITDDYADRYDDDDNDKPDYLYIGCDRNLNIRCVRTDFEVINFRIDNGSSVYIEEENTFRIVEKWNRFAIFFSCISVLKFMREC